MQHRLLAVVVAAAGVSLAAQEVERPAQIRPDAFSVTIEGCVSGGRLEPSSKSTSRAVSATLAVPEYKLEGSRAMLRILREEHNGHLEEITGIVEVSREREQRQGVFTTDLGKGGTIVVGRRERRSIGTEPAARTATLRIESVRHVADRCSDD